MNIYGLIVKYNGKDVEYWLSIFVYGLGCI